MRPYLQQEQQNNLLTECCTTCELINGRLGHAVSQHTGELREEEHFKFITSHAFKKTKHVASCSKPTDLCPFTLDTLTMEPLVLIRCGTQS